MPRLVVRASPIAGEGCFAAEAIAAGALVVEYTGEVIGAEEAYRREADTGRDGIYTFWLGEEAAIDAYGDEGPARFINHCCEPNCVYEIADGRILILAARNIGAGEELTIDYRYAAEGSPVVCRCGAGSCRGRINAMDD